MNCEQKKIKPGFNWFIIIYSTLHMYDFILPLKINK